MKESRAKSEKMPGHLPRTQNKKSCKNARPIEGQANTKTAVPELSFTGRKIIPFPGVSLHGPDYFQDEIDNFLQEIGYIE